MEPPPTKRRSVFGINADEEEHELHTMVSLSDRLTDCAFRIASELSETLPRNRVVSLLLIVVEWMQITSYVIHERSSFPWSPIVVDWTIVLQRLLRLDYVSYNAISHLLSSIFILIYLCCNLTVATWLNSLIRQGVGKRQLWRSAPLRYLHVVIVLHSPLLFLPFLSLLFHSTTCSTALNDELIGCGTFLHFFWVFFVSCIVLLLIAQTYLIESLCFDSKPRSSVWLAQPHCRHSINTMIEKIAVVAAFALFIAPIHSTDAQQSWNLSIVLLATTHLMGLSFKKYLPYLNYGVLLVAGTLLCIRMWFAQCVLLFMLADVKSSQIGGTVMVCAATPLVILCSLALMYKRRVCITMKGTGELATAFEIEQNVRFKLLDTNKRIFELKRDNIGASGILKETETIQEEGNKKIETTLEEGLKNFSDSLSVQILAIVYYTLILEKHGRAQSIIMRTQRLMSSSTSIPQRFELYQCRRVLQNAEYKGGAEEILMKMNFSNKCRHVESLVMKAMVQQYRFWTHLLPDVVDEDALQAIGSDVVRTITKTQQLIEELSRGHSNTVPLLKVKGEFLLHVLGDVVAGSRLLEKAENIEANQELAQAQENVSDEAYLDPGTTNAVLIVSASEPTVGIVREVTPEALHMLGLEREALIGKNIGVILPSRIAAHHDQLVTRFTNIGVDNVIGLTRDLFCIHGRSGFLQLVKVNLNLLMASNEADIQVTASLWLRDPDAMVCLVESDTGVILHMTQPCHDFFVPKDEELEKADLNDNGDLLLSLWIPDFQTICNEMNAPEGAVTLVVDADNLSKGAKVFSKSLITQGLSLITFQLIEYETESCGSSLSQSKNLTSMSARSSHRIEREINRRAQRWQGVQKSFTASPDILEEENEESSVSSLAVPTSSNMSTANVKSLQRPPSKLSVGFSDVVLYEDQEQESEEEEEEEKEEEEEEKEKEKKENKDKEDKEAGNPSQEEQVEVLMGEIEPFEAPLQRQQNVAATAAAVTSPSHPMTNSKGVQLHTKKQKEEENDSLFSFESDTSRKNDSETESSVEADDDSMEANFSSVSEMSERSNFIEAANADDLADDKSLADSNLSGTSSQSAAGALRRHMLTNRTRIERSIVTLIFVFAMSLGLVLTMTIINFVMISNLMSFYSSSTSFMLSTNALEAQAIDIAFMVESFSLANIDYRPMPHNESMTVSFKPMVLDFESKFASLFIDQQNFQVSSVLSSFQGDLIRIVESDGFERHVSVLQAAQTYMTRAKRLHTLSQVSFDNKDASYILHNTDTLVAALRHVSELYWFSTESALEEFFKNQYIFLYIFISCVVFLHGAIFWPRLRNVFRTKREVLQLFQEIPRASVVSMLNRCRTALPDTSDFGMEIMQETQHLSSIIMKPKEKRRRFCTASVQAFVKFSTLFVVAIVYGILMLVLQNYLVTQSVSANVELFVSGIRPMQSRLLQRHLQVSMAAINLTDTQLASRIEATKQEEETLMKLHHSLLFGGVLTTSEQERITGYLRVNASQFDPEVKLQRRPLFLEGAIKRYSTRQELMLTEASCRISHTLGSWNQYSSHDVFSTEMCMSSSETIFDSGLHRALVMLGSYTQRALELSRRYKMPRPANISRSLMQDYNVVQIENMTQGGLRFGLDAASHLYKQEHEEDVHYFVTSMVVLLTLFLLATAAIFIFKFVPAMKETNDDIARVRFMLLLVPMNILKDINGIRQFITNMS